jgi:hypothetical protein
MDVRWELKRRYEISTSRFSRTLILSERERESERKEAEVAVVYTGFV